MALVIKQTRRLLHPSETYELEGSDTRPPVWFEVSVPLSGADMATVTAATVAGVKLEMIALALKGWSYDAAISRDTIGQLDLWTMNWLYEQLEELNRPRSDDEKKVSTAPSSPTTPTAEDSPPSSAT